MDARGLDRVAQAGSAIWALLPKLVPLAYRVGRWVRTLAVLATVAAAITLVATLVIDVPTTPAPVLAMLAWAALLAYAPVVLWLFHGALQDVLALPDWLRSSPDLAKKHAAELAGLVLAAHGDPSGLPAADRPPRRVGVREVFKAGRMLLEARHDLPGYGRALRLLNPVFLVLVAVALVGAVLELGVAGVAVLLALVVRLLG